MFCIFETMYDGRRETGNEGPMKGEVSYENSVVERKKSSFPRI